MAPAALCHQIKYVSRSRSYLFVKGKYAKFIKKIQQDATIYQNFIIPYLYEAQHVSGVGGLVGVVRHSVPDNAHQLHVHQPSTYEKLEAAGAVLDS